MQVLPLLLALCATAVVAIPVDNGVDGDPEIECGPTSITISFNTQQNFEGHVYVKGRYFEPDCRNDEVGRRVAGIDLPFSTCGVRRSRSLNPKGVFVSTTIIISFHPLFITKVDRAYTLQCFYMEADKTVSTEIEVSMLTTGFQTEFVPMPVCRYELHDGSPSGPIIQFAIVGQAIYHKWICDTETVDTFCMVVHTCYVDDGQGDRVDLITTDGCAVDGNLIGNLEYPTDLMAGQEAHVFKYADRVSLYFTCQITITVKEPFEECPRPQCAEPNFTRGRKRRDVERRDDGAATVVDVTTDELEVLDVSDHRLVLPTRRQPRVLTTRVVDGVCVSPAFLGVVVGLAFVAIAATAAVFVTRK